MDNNKCIIGRLGEEQVFEYLLSTHFYLDLNFSEDKFDDRKDMYGTRASDGGIDLIEVKTVTQIQNRKSWLLHHNQWKKIDDCDRLFYIKVPLRRNENSVMHEVDKTKYNLVRGWGPYGLTVRFYPLNAMKPVKVLDESLAMKLYDLSPSTYKR